jgi:hypothetical protein
MVRRPGRLRRGASTLGCLVSLVLFAAAIYYGVHIGRVYYRYYALMEDMRQAARFAQVRTDDAIRRNLTSRIDELGIPPEAKRLFVRRTGPPWHITIRTEYREEITLPIGPPRYINFKPTVESRF